MLLNWIVVVSFAISLHPVPVFPAVGTFPHLYHNRASRNLKRPQMTLLTTIQFLLVEKRSFAVCFGEIDIHHVLKVQSTQSFFLFFFYLRELVEYTGSLSPTCFLYYGYILETCLKWQTCNKMVPVVFKSVSQCKFKIGFVGCRQLATRGPKTQLKLSKLNSTTSERFTQSIISTFIL